MQQLSLLDQDEKPAGVPMAIWQEFVCVCDDVRKSGMKCWSARAAMEIIRYENVVKRGNAEFKINNNLQRDLAVAYLNMRRCYSFFELRDRYKRAA